MSKRDKSSMKWSTGETFLIQIGFSLTRNRQRMEGRIHADDGELVDLIIEGWVVLY